jgi:outer membrane protein TolC
MKNSITARPLAAPIFIALACLAGDASGTESSTVLTLPEAEQRAVELDPLAAKLQAQGAVYSELADAEAQLPDPELSIGLAEVPLDNLDLSDHEDTELRLGVSQAFPAGRTRHYQAERMTALAGAEQARILERRRFVLRSVRGAYVKLYYEREAERVLERNQRWFDELVEVTANQYAQGRDNQHDVTRAQLELSLVEDRLEQSRATSDIARAELAEWVGVEPTLRPQAEQEPLLRDIAAIADPAAVLATHPLLAVEDQAIAAAQSSVRIAEEQYKPSWMLDFMLSENTAGAYDQQAGPDFAGVFLRVSLPVFPDRRQDRRLAASRQEATAAIFGRTDRLRELTRRFEVERAKLARLERRIELYRTRAAVEAAQTQEAAFSAWRNDLADFETLVRAHALALETELELLRLRAAGQDSRAVLLYLAGEPT